jgi:membrane associated rhomboid family serine protease
MPLTPLDRLERRFGRFAIPNLTVILIAGQVFLYVLSQLPQGISLERVAFLPDRVLRGEVWRLATFLFTPPAMQPLFVIFYFMLLYTFGSALETHWGTFKYNVFLLTGYLANVAAGFIALAIFRSSAPPMPPIEHWAPVVISNGFLYGSLFFAFARLYPDFVIMLFFVLPVRIKWLALLAWLGYLLAFIDGSWSDRLAVVASIANYLMFFGREHWRQAKHMRRRQEFFVKAKKATAKPRHVCAVCGVTSDESPKMLFRYCSKCAGQQCYCPEHIQDHVHVTEEELAGK